MAIMNYLKSFLKKRPTQQPVEYIEEKPRDIDAVENKNPPKADLLELESEVDLSPHQDLENYARGLSVTKESIERWISSGLLMPDEMKVAEKIVQIMRKG